MTSKQQSAQTSQPPNSRHQSQDDMVEVGHEDESDIEVEDITDQPEPDTQQENLPDRTRTRSPAYVAPIPKIGSIPKVSPGIALSPERPKLPPFVGSFLMGKKVDEYGDIVDDQTGQVLARAGGDLPEIVGRKVSNRDGDILGDNGELLGYVADVEIERKGSTSPQSPRAEAQPRSLLDMMRKANASLMVDHLGNILDPAGNIVGKFHDNNNPLHRKEREEQELRERIQQQAAAGPSSVRKKKQEKKPEKEDKEGQEDGAAEEQEEHPSPPPKSPKREQQKQSQTKEQEQPRPPRRTEEERRQNAEAWRKENPSESPSDIFLDVKSTKEGIQLTIRIPTVFGGQQIKPNISFS